MRNIKVHFGHIVALDGVDFSIGRREVVGLLGNNGAGKSTLVKTLLGYHPRSAGEFFFEGRPVDFRSAREARAAGIETVFQDFSLAENLSVLDNFFVGRELTRGGPLALRDRPRMEKLAEAALRAIGLRSTVSMKSKISSLSGGERQLVAIGRALFFARKLLVLDEPTSALSESSVNLLREMVKRAKETGVSVLFVTHNAPEVFEVADRFVVLDNGRVYAALEKADTDLLQLEKLLISRRLAAVKEMAAGVAHQVRNPLGILKVSVELLRKQLPPSPAHTEVDDLARVMLNEIDSLDHVVGSFMDFAHQRPPLKAPCSMAEVVRESVATLPASSYPDVEVRVVAPADLGPCTVDAALIKQAISNIIMNAIDASPKKGAVEVRVFQEGAATYVEVQDWGCGMEEELRRKIFTPFFSTKTSGTGLGLAIAHRIVEQHNGTINVSSAPGKGSTFQLVL